MLPIRCFSCNKVIGHYFFIFKEWKNNYLDFFEKYDIDRYCCRKIFLTSIDICKFNPEFNEEFVVLKKKNEVKKIVPCK
jgi:DNA-directed RNA polymerase subunit N (RpoN/RPB10)